MISYFQFVEHLDSVYNNPRANKQNGNWDDKEEKKILDKMLYDNIRKRMVKGYNKNQSKIEKKPSQKPISQNQKRELKIADLDTRSEKNGNKISWPGLE